jgi:hypothetical protein
MRALRWAARLVFVLALICWGRMALRSMDHPETWHQTQKRTAAFVVMMAAGFASFPTPKPEGKGTRRRERF